MAFKAHVNVPEPLASEADFLILASFELDGEPRWEQLWVRQISSDLFRVQCVPFFVYGLSAGDVVRAPLEGGRYELAEVVEKSGHLTLRVYLKDPDEDKRQDIRRSLIELVEQVRGVIEFYSRILLAIDLPDADGLRVVAAYLRRVQAAGLLEYEDGDVEKLT